MWKNRRFTKRLTTSVPAPAEDGSPEISQWRDQRDEHQPASPAELLSASLVRCECPANDHFCRMARKAVTLRRPFGDQARAVDPAPLFQAPLFRLDGILGRVLAARLIDAEPSLRGSEEKALK
jgi:hypothetical protein